MIEKLRKVYKVYGVVEYGVVEYGVFNFYLSLRCKWSGPYYVEKLYITNGICASSSCLMS